ncbi:hypothetical protein CB0940_05372 [Cercospora beticola]|uniref:BTB domain-containing protein n=1 Tax=Cercospora beticola TaxID=122368 RepID=A0A2G5HZJ1_CERBT|nr:hypothetical protein CB0940_05372 [Cercospora beticola]PIA97956.1 hypothetical protein CB0940_05372 [Cercospora beticola]WPA97909.1 hypothetical protein RHO25_002520 [Cercospora beticola]
MSLYEKIARSKPCKFRIGEGKTVFYVHSALVTEQSKGLHDLIYENDGDTVKNSIALDRVDADTFSRFVEYLYTGDYAAAKPKARVQSVESSAAENSDEEPTPASSNSGRDGHDESCSEHIDAGTFWGTRHECTCGFEGGKSGLEVQFGAQPAPPSFSWGAFEPAPPAKPNKKKQKKPEDQRPPISAKAQAWEAFKALTWPLAKKEAKGPEYFARPNEAGEDYSEVLLSHARLHIFACVYDIGRLQALTLRNLHKTLVAFTIFDDCAQDVGELLEYCHCPFVNHAANKLPEMVDQYVACNMGNLMGDSLFRDAVQNCDASFGLLDLLVDRLRILEQDPEHDGI